MKMRYLIAMGGAMLFLAGRPAAGQNITLTVENGSGTIGGTGVVTVNVDGPASSGVQLDVLLPLSVFVELPHPPPPAPITTCVADRFPATGAFSASATSPTSPAPPTGMQRLRLAVVDNMSTDRITSGVLYVCTLAIKAGIEPTQVTLEATRTSATDSQGGVLPTTGVNGTFDVSIGPTATSTPVPPTNTPTATVTPTATNTSPVSPTPTATVTPTRTRTPTITNTRAPGPGEDDGCEVVVAPKHSQGAWLLLIPAAVLIWRRRSR